MNRTAKTLSRQPTPVHDDSTRAADLHLVLPPTTTLTRSFRAEKELQSYRRMIYTINKQGSFRYRTLRAEDEVFGLVIWRML